MPPSDRRPDREPPEALETLDLLARLLASVSDRLDSHGEAVSRLVLAQGQAQAAAAPDRVAQATAAATARSVRDALAPDLRRIADALEVLDGTKAILRERLRLVDRDEARRGRWRVQPVVVLGIPLALVLLLGVLMPSAVSQTPLTCRATGGLWWGQTEHFPAACLFEAQARRHQATGENGQDG